MIINLQNWRLKFAVNINIDHQICLFGDLNTKALPSKKQALVHSAHRPWISNFLWFLRVCFWRQANTEAWSTIPSLGLHRFNSINLALSAVRGQKNCHGIAFGSAKAACTTSQFLQHRLAHVAQPWFIDSARESVLKFLVITCQEPPDVVHTTVKKRKHRLHSLYKVQHMLRLAMFKNYSIRLLFAFFSVASQRLGACLTWGGESENQPRRGQFLPGLQAHSWAMGPKHAEKRAAAADLQPTTLKSDSLLGATTECCRPHGLLVQACSPSSLSQSTSKCLLRVGIMFAVTSLLALGLPSQVLAFTPTPVQPVYDAQAIAAINRLISIIRTETNGRYLNGIQISLQSLIAQGVMSPNMVSSVATVSQNVSQSMNDFIVYAATEGIQLDTLAKTIGEQTNQTDNRFYSRAIQNPSSCSSDNKIASKQIEDKCLEIQNLRTYKVLHSGKFQKALAVSAASILNLSNIPPANRADVELKNQTINLIRLMQSQASEIYRAQQDYLQSRIEISEEIRVALVNKKSGKNPSNGAGSPLGAPPQSASQIFKAAGTSLGYIIN